MRRASPVTRRGLLRLLSGASWLAVAGPAGAAGDKILDQGIGGTGIRPGPDEEGDRGIGGTGVVGTIRGFGSIIVNDLRIAYPPDVPVTIDGRPARVDDLRVGQVVQTLVRTLAQPGEGGLSTAGIAVIHEVVGPVQRVGADRLTVLGQSVATAGLPPEMPRPVLGARVAVSGLRRPDGSIAASRIDPAGDAPDLVAGPVRRGPAGALRIGNLPLANVDPALAGGRAVAFGSLAAGRLAVMRAVPASEPFGAEVRRLLIEAYVTREGGSLRTGAGYAVTGRGGLVPAGGGLAILDGRAGRGGRLDLDGLRLRPDPAGRESGRGPGGPDRPGQNGVRGGPGEGRGGPHGGSPGGPRGGPRGEPGGRPGGFGRSPDLGGERPFGGSEGGRLGGSGRGEIDPRLPGGEGMGRFGGPGGPGGQGGVGGPGGQGGFGGPGGGAPQGGPGGFGRPGGGEGFGGGGFGGGGRR